MDILNKLFEINDTHILSNISNNLYEIDSDDDDEDIEYINIKRNEFIEKYNKINNRQFKLNNKRYYINKYQIIEVEKNSQCCDLYN